MNLSKHDLSSAFDTASKEDYQGIKDSIAKNGYDEHQPVILFEDRILDGYHRAKACDELGIEAPVRQFPGTDEEALDYVFKMNLDRRHLTQRSKAMALIVRNDKLPASKRSSVVAIAARVGMRDTRFAKQLERLAAVDIEVALKVVRGEISAAKAIKDVLGEMPGGTNRERDLVLHVRSKKDADDFRAAQDSKLMTEKQAITKAVRLFVEWASAQAA